MRLKILLVVIISVSSVISHNVETSPAAYEKLIAHVKSLEHKLGKVEEKMEGFQKELEAQKTLNHIQGEEISSQRILIDWLRTVNTELKSRVDKLEIRNENDQTLDTEGTIKSEHQRGSPVQQDGESETKQKVRIVRQEREPVAFSAYLNRDLSNLGPGHTIQYGATRLNEGNAFNAHTGIFTVPIDGVYLFAFACEDYHHHRIYADILVDGTRNSLVLEGGPSGLSHAMGTNVVILRLTKGQSVWVAIDAGGHDDTLQQSATTFSGVFLYN